jgi:hypothetical protein
MLLITPDGQPVDVETRKQLSQLQAVRAAERERIASVPGCARKLVDALVSFHSTLGSASFRPFVKFVLACRGTYEPTSEGTQVGPGTTTNHDLFALMKAGWDLRALRVNGKLSQFGSQFSTFITLNRGRPKMA